MEGAKKESFFGVILSIFYKKSRLFFANGGILCILNWD